MRLQSLGIMRIHQFLAQSDNGWLDHCFGRVWSDRLHYSWSSRGEVRRRTLEPIQAITRKPAADGPEVAHFN